MLRETAGWFFHDYSIISQEYSVILVGRLTEQSGKGEKKNLSVVYIAEELARLSLSSPAINELHKSLVRYRGRIERSRHKLVAHRDLDTIRNPTEPGNWPLEEVRQFLSNLNQFCDEVALQIGLSPSDFLNISSKGDAADLVRVLRRAKQE